MKYIVIQAGGKGTRLGHITKNKPKALAPVENLPMIFHLFRKYPDKRFIIIADYKKEVLHKYLSCFGEVKNQVVDASGKGTCAGIKQALDLLPANEPFMLIWSDLILPADFELPKEYENEAKAKKNYIGISSTFPCRWKYEDGIFSEEKSTGQGVAGFFLFRKKSVIEDVPENGELVQWMQEKELKFEELSLSGTREFGVLKEYEKLEQIKTRPFNRITIDGDVLLKEPTDAQGRALAERESAWYEIAREKAIAGIPQIYATSPLKMEYIIGSNIYECNFGHSEKRRILESIVNMLKKLHASEEVEADSFSVKEMYFNKTIRRLSKIRDLVPLTEERYIRINGKNCRNVFFYQERLESAVDSIRCEKFSFIHGDCTFSNMMVRDNGEPVLIDPRGYFGYTEIFGDEKYDWAKLYYSIVGNYDRFNLKKFNLDIYGDEVKLDVESNGWENLEEDFFDFTGADVYETKLLHAVIWLSLTTYAWQDYDSVCGAFYNGLYYLEEVL